MILFMKLSQIGQFLTAFLYHPGIIQWMFSGLRHTPSLLTLIFSLPYRLHALWTSLCLLDSTIRLFCLILGASLVAQRLKPLPAMRETWVQSLGQEDPLEKEMATHSSILGWRISKHTLSFTTFWSGIRGSLTKTWSQFWKYKNRRSFCQEVSFCIFVFNAHGRFLISFNIWTYSRP